MNPVPCFARLKVGHRSKTGGAMAPYRNLVIA